MKPPTPKPIKPQTRWAIADATGMVLWVAPLRNNTRKLVRDTLGLFYHPTCGDHVTRVLITEVPRGLAR